MQEQLHKDTASRGNVHNLSQALALNSALDGDPLGFIHLRTKAGAAVNGMRGHYERFTEHLLCVHGHNSRRRASRRGIIQACF